MMMVKCGYYFAKNARSPRDENVRDNVDYLYIIMQCLNRKKWGSVPFSGEADGNGG